MEYCIAANTSRRNTCLRRLFVAIITITIATHPFFVGISENGNQNNIEATSLFDRHWPEMKEKMCPKMSPNPNVWSALFELARMELGFSEYRVKSNKADDGAVANFFSFNSGGMGYVSHDNKHHMVYLPILKGGSNQISSNLKDKLGTNGSFWDGGPTMQDAFSASRIPPAQLNQTCVVTAVRDPVEHFISAYNEVEGRNTPAYMKKRQNPKFRSWTNPLLYAGYGNGTTARFEQFVSDFVGDPQKAGFYVLEVNHVFSMTGVLWGLKKLKEVRGEEAPRLAYLPSLRDLDTEFPKFLGGVCAGLPHLDSFEKTFVHPSQSDPFNFNSAAKKVWSNEEGTSRALCAIHALDYACFESIPVPSLCQSVYANQTFRDHLLYAAE